MPGGTRQGTQGGNTGSVEWTPQARKRRATGRRRQEDRWAAKAGPVTTAYLPGMEPPPEPRKPRKAVRQTVVVGTTGGPVEDDGEDWPPWEPGA